MIHEAILNAADLVEMDNCLQRNLYCPEVNGESLSFLKKSEKVLLRGMSRIPL